jgi:membrane protease YdiL (CAAX protease family)
MASGALLAVLAGLSAVGLLGWRWLSPGLRPLPPGETLTEGVLLALAGFLGMDLLTGLLVRVTHLPDPPPLVQLVPLRALAGLVVAGAVLAAVSARGGVRTLGLRRTGGRSSPLLAGVAAWLAFLPVLVAVLWLNDGIFTALGMPRPAQRWLADFVSSPDAQASPATWLGFVLVLPFCEELYFRGGLYGALRRVLSAPLAVAVCAIAFGVVHDPAYMLPAAALGALFAVLYERTGSLAAPVACHALHNAITLAIVSSHPAWAV